MPLLKSVGLLVADAVLLAMSLKIQQHPDSPIVMAEMVHVEDVLAVMFSSKNSGRRGWVSVARQGEGILVLLSESTNTLLTRPTGEVKRFELQAPALRQVLAIDNYRLAAEIVLNYVTTGVVPKRDW